VANQRGAAKRGGPKQGSPSTPKTRMALEEKGGGLRLTRGMVAAGKGKGRATGEEVGEPVSVLGKRGSHSVDGKVSPKRKRVEVVLTQAKK
jgi:hypothetical protein